MLRPLTPLIVSAMVTLLPSCAGTGSYLWINDVPDSELVATRLPQVSVGDVISVRVFGQEPMSVRVTVRGDGVISMPLIGPVRAVGRHPEELSRDIEKQLEPYVTSPHVLTVIEESHIRVIMAGEITRPGTLVLDGPVDLLTAIANAGGITQYASESGIFVLRSTPAGVNRIRFHWDEVSRGVGRTARFRLRDNDQVVVE
jgi:polysaccharide biosynthesis/export protein